MGKNDIIIVCLLVVLICFRTENISISLGQVKLDWRTSELGSWGFVMLYCKLNRG